MELKRTLAIIMAGGKGERLSPLTADRTKPAVPFGGIYRIIDFTLSNCINSGLHRICILAQYKSLSLHRHVRDGWNIFNYELGGFVDFIPAQQRRGEHWYLGTADAVYQNIYSIRQVDPYYTIVLAGDHIYKMDYSDMMRFHIEKGAAVTVATIEAPLADGKRFGVMGIDDTQRVLSFAEKPENPQPLPNDPNNCLASMGIYVFNTDMMIRELERDAKQDSSHDFGRDIIPRLIEKYPVYAYLFEDRNKKEQKYWRDIGTLDAYWEANMDLATIDPMFNLYDKEWPIRTFHLQAPPAKFAFSGMNEGRAGYALDSIVSNGCIVSGSMVKNCVISPFVRIHSYSQIEDSVIMHGTRIGRHSKIRRAIIDKDCHLPEGTVIGYNLDEDRERFMVTDDGIVVVSKFTGNPDQNVHRGV